LRSLPIVATPYLISQFYYDFLFIFSIVSLVMSLTLKNFFGGHTDTARNSQKSVRYEIYHENRENEREGGGVWGY